MQRKPMNYQSGGRTLSQPVWGGPDEASARGTVRTARGFAPARFNWLGVPIPQPPPQPPPPPVVAPPAAPPPPPPPPPIMAVNAGGGSTEAPRPWQYDPGNAGADATAGIDPMGGQEIGPGGVPFNMENLWAAIVDAMGPSLTGNRFADIALQIAQSALPGPAGALAGIAGMGARAAAASRAPDNPEINPWADITYDAMGRPNGTRSGRPLGEALAIAGKAATANPGLGNPQGTFREGDLPNEVLGWGLAERAADDMARAAGRTPGIFGPGPSPALGIAPTAPTLSPTIPGTTTTTSATSPEGPSLPAAAIPGEDDPVPQSELNFLPDLPPVAPEDMRFLPDLPPQQPYTEAGGAPAPSGGDKTPSAGGPDVWGGGQDIDKSNAPADNPSSSSSWGGDKGGGGDGGDSGSGGAAETGGGAPDTSGGYGGGPSDTSWNAVGGRLEGGTPGVDSIPIQAMEDEYMLSVGTLEYLNQMLFGVPGTEQIHDLLDQVQIEATGETPNNADGPGPEGMGDGMGMGDEDNGMALQRLTSFLQSMGGSGGGPGMIGGAPPPTGGPGGMGAMAGIPGAPAPGSPPMPMGPTPPAPMGRPPMPAGAMTAPPPMPRQPMTPLPQTMGAGMAKGGRMEHEQRRGAPGLIMTITAAKPRARYAEGGGVRETPMVGFADGGVVRDMPERGFRKGGRMKRRKRK